MLHLLGGLDIIQRLEVLAGSGHQVGLVRMLLGKAHVLLLVCDHGGIGELTLQFGVGGDEFL